MRRNLGVCVCVCVWGGLGQCGLKTKARQSVYSPGHFHSSESLAPLPDLLGGNRSHRFRRVKMAAALSSISERKRERGGGRQVPAQRATTRERALMKASVQSHSRPSCPGDVCLSLSLENNNNNKPPTNRGGYRRPAPTEGRSVRSPRRPLSSSWGSGPTVGRLSFPATSKALHIEKDQALTA